MHETARRPATPGPAERARTIAKRGGRATVLPSGDTSDRARPLLHHVHADGTAALLLPDEHPLVATAWQNPRGELTGVLEVTDSAPVRLREPVRGLLWLTGRLRLPDPETAHAEVLRVAEQRPDPRLLDAGHGASVLRLESVSLVLADAESTDSLEPAEFAAAEPDPFCLHEDGWLRHLELSHRDVVGLLTRYLPVRLRGGHLRPLGLDRYGVRLRVEAADGDHDVRIGFSRPVEDSEQLSTELRRLMGCPFLAAQR
ncbi:MULTISPECIES: DUF2470 domain-containing protein [Actinopolyspora]|uniref:DUF2470 domain-containing protein n=1 Tax=Actinopolyspora saharensis TaxID=995062 RepID=A0A1H1FHL5_9ACTN|nr:MULTISPECIES: DUF2470 domain-containing protein [Actinopolyspora]NHD18821.1 DUF2470 domain-containing protein [Actinopolyspora sp. BKK2]NHE77244.1 DUF2470 domain-containing protein [Actinopolyspora sp. BKK1]SDR00377.1 Protein of unknown function [Actinopolyspora saharensis]